MGFYENHGPEGLACGAWFDQVHAVRQNLESYASAVGSDLTGGFTVFTHGSFTTGNLPSCGGVDPFEAGTRLEAIAGFLIVAEEKSSVLDVQGNVRGLRFAFDE